VSRWTIHLDPAEAAESESPTSASSYRSTSLAHDPSGQTPRPSGPHR
jgi:hypothetical protein